MKVPVALEQEERRISKIQGQDERDSVARVIAVVQGRDEAKIQQIETQAQRERARNLKQSA